MKELLEYPSYVIEQITEIAQKIVDGELLTEYEDDFFDTFLEETGLDQEATDA